MTRLLIPIFAFVCLFAATASAQTLYDALPPEEKAIVDRLAAYTGVPARQVISEYAILHPDVEDWIEANPELFLQLEAGAAASRPTAPQSSAPVKSAPPRQTMPQPRRQGTPTPNTATELLALIDSVPAANRPVAVEIDTYYQPSGFGPYSSAPYPVYLFADGRATDCFSTDPKRLNMAAAAAASNENCEVMKWRKSAAGYETWSADDDEWFALDNPSRVGAFQRGEAVTLALSSTSAGTKRRLTDPEDDIFILRPDGTGMTDNPNAFLRHLNAPWDNNSDHQQIVSFRYAVHGNIIALDDGAGPKLLFIAPIRDGDRITRLYFSDEYYYAQP